MMNHSVDVKRPEPRWTPLQCISPAGRPEPELLQHIACLKQEIADLKDYSERVTKELRTLRLTHATSSLLDTSNDDATEESRTAPGGESTQTTKAGTAAPPGPKAASELPLPAWALNMQLMCPLLAAYDDRIKEQQALLDRRESDVQRMAKSIMDLTKENESLAQEVRVKTNQLKALFTGDTQGKEPDCSVTSLIHEKNELAELYNVLKEQNEVLTDQNHVMKCHIEQADQQVELLRTQLREAEQQQAVAAEIIAQNESLQQLLQKTNQQVEATTRDRDAFQQRAHKLENDFTALDRLCKELQEKRAAQENQIEQERRTACELADRFKIFENEKQAQFHVLEEELAELQKNYSQLSEQNEETEQGTERAREIISYLETKCSTLENENSTLKHTLGDLDQKVQEMTLEKGKADVSLSVMRARLEKMREQNSEQMTLERNLMEERSQSAKKQLQQQVDELRSKCQRLTETNAKLSLAAESAERCRKAAAAEAAHAQEELQAATRAHQAVADQLQQTKGEAERERDKLREELDSFKATMVERLAAQESIVKKHQDEASRAGGLLAGEKQRTRQAETTAETLKSQIAQLNRKLVTLEKDVELMKREHEAKTDELIRKHAENIGQLNLKLRGVLEESHLKEQQAVNLVQEEDELRQRLKCEYEAERKIMEVKLEKLQSSNTLLRSKLLELVRCIDHASSKGKLGGSTSIDSTEISLGIASVRSACTRDSTR